MAKPSQLPQLEALKDLVQEAIDRAVTGVESIHQTIMDLPFAAVENNELINDQLKTARRLKSNAIASVYDMIRKINNDIGETISDLIGVVEDHAEAQDGITRTTDAIDNAVGNAVESLQEEAAKVKDTMKKEADKIKAAANNLKSNVEKEVNSAQKTVKKKATAAKKAAQKSVDDVKKNAKTAAQA